MLVTIMSQTVVCMLAKAVAGGSVESGADATPMGIVPPCASQSVSCGATATTRPAITIRMASTSSGPFAERGGVLHSTVMMPSFTPMLHVNV